MKSKIINLHSFFELKSKRLILFTKVKTFKLKITDEMR